MKNEILLNLTIKDSFLDLIGIKKNEIFEYRPNLFYFERSRGKFLIKISTSNYDSKRDDCIDLSFYRTDVDHGYISYGLNLFNVRDIKTEKDFEKFRIMMDLEFHVPKEISCNE